MLRNDEVKDILYSTINNIGKERIRSDISHYINLSLKYIELIMAECINLQHKCMIKAFHIYHTNTPLLCTSLSVRSYPACIG